MTRTEGGAAGLTPKGLDAFGLAMRAISNQRMNMSVCDARVGTRSVGTGEALGVHPLWCSPPAFDLTPRSDRERHRPHNRRVGAAEATGGAIVWGAWLEKTLERATPGGCGLPLQDQDGESFGNTAARERT